MPRTMPLRLTHAHTPANTSAASGVDSAARISAPPLLKLTSVTRRPRLAASHSRMIRALSARRPKPGSGITSAAQPRLRATRTMRAPSAPVPRCSR
ncbi:MAG: hypothetical protein U1F77_12520 [Kiritimatiellia bacterium]